MSENPEGVQFRTMELGVKIARNYGKHEVEFQIRELVEVSSGAERHAHYERLIASLNWEIASYEQTHLQGVKIPHPSEEGGHDKLTQRTVKISKVSHGFTDGKHVYRVHGGMYEKWGVPLYPECKMPFTLEDFPLGDTVLPTGDWYMVVELEGVKAKRVQSIADHE